MVQFNPLLDGYLTQGYLSESYRSLTSNTKILNLRINFFYLLRTFCPHFGSFCVVSSFTTFRPNFTSGLLQVIYRDLSCNHITSNYCLPQLLSIALRFWPSKPLAGLGRNWNRYLLTMLTWNRRDSTPLYAAPFVKTRVMNNK